MTAVTIAVKRAPTWWALVPALCLSGWLGTAMAQEAPRPLAPHQKVEVSLMEKLARIQSDPSTTLASFTTDGCSGGMSGIWSQLAGLWPAFTEYFGDQPPWVGCCIEHDRAYWLGLGGFEGRLAADQSLRACVHETGERLKEELSAEWSQPPERVEATFLLAGELMYSAVRLGGGPCTPLPWRWGYGWPLCPFNGDLVPRAR